MFGGVKLLNDNVKTTLWFSSDSRILKVGEHFGAKD